MATQNHFDVIIIGTGAGGGTLAHKLAPTGKKISAPGTRRLCSARERQLESPRRQPRRKVPDQRDVARQRRQRAPSAHQLLRRRQYEILRRRAVSSAQRRLRRDPPSWRRLSGLADSVTKTWNLITPRRSGSITCTATAVKIPLNRPQARPTLIRRSATSRAFNNYPMTSPAWACARFTPRSGVMLNEKDPHASRCIRCETCDGFPCLVNAKSDAQVCAVDPALEHANVTLMTNAYVERLETNRIRARNQQSDHQEQWHSRGSFG